jgi:two-component system cell cycle sensor histidine kinase/response regulator CckA
LDEGNLGVERAAEAPAATDSAVRAVTPDSIADGAIDPVFRTLADALSDNLILLDPDGRVRYINHTVPDLSVARVLGTSVYDYVPDEYREVMRRCHARVLQTGQPDRYETVYVSDTGESSFWESRVSPLLRDGVVVGLVQIASNVTERRLAAADRDRLFNLSIDMLCVAGADGYFKRVSPAFEHTLGHSEAELLAAPFFDFVHPDDRERTREAMVRLSQGEVVIDFENRYRCRDGTYRWISWRSAADATGQQVFAVGRDVTERRDIDIQLLQSQKMQAVGQLAGGVAHDFNNLVLAIDLNTDFARKTTDEATRLECLDEISQAVRRAGDLTRQLLSFARQQPTTLAPVDLNQTIESMRAMLRRLIPESIEIRFSPGLGLPAVLADSGQLEQVVLNLCLNARDAMPTGGTLTIETVELREPARVQLQVRDTGTGISPDVRERLFEPFFSTKAKGLGTGLGLATVYGIVDRHGGRIAVSSELGAGSAFTIVLPASARSPSFSGHVDGDQIAPIHTAATVLVAEDEPGVRRAIVSLLGQAGYRTLVARDGAHALQLFDLHAGEIDVLLFDVVMPRLGGPGAVERIRRRAPGVPVIFMSGYSADLDAAPPVVLACRRIGKPFESRALLALVREALDEARAARAT